MCAQRHGLWHVYLSVLAGCGTCGMGVVGCYDSLSSSVEGVQHMYFFQQQQQEGGLMFGRMGGGTIMHQYRIK